MKELTSKEHDAQLQNMKAFDEQMPCVGIFWYDMNDKGYCFKKCVRE